MSPHLSGRRSLLLIALGGLGLTGYFGPWTPHRAAGLVITGLDLAEFVKFLPEVMSGQIPLQRAVFYAPLVAGSLIASLIASRRGLAWPPRALLLLAALAFALALLPPAWSPATLTLPEFRIQIIAMAICLVIVPLAALVHYLPDRLILAGLTILALVTALWPAWTFLEVQPAIATVYSTPLPLGWGFWVCLIGFVALAFVSMAFALSRSQPRRR